MPEIKPSIKLLYHTPDPEIVIGTAARTCYSDETPEEIYGSLGLESARKTIRRIRKAGHMSPFRHATFTFSVTCSRACSHQLVRHHVGFDPNQQSQRYVYADKEEGFDFIAPPEIERCSRARDIRAYIQFKSIMLGLSEHYASMVRILKDAGRTDEQAQEDARYLLPNAAATNLVITLNAEAILHFVRQRTCRLAQWEIRGLAEDMLKQVKERWPVLFEDAGPACVWGGCTEGARSCKQPRKGEL